jgi:hypothetical protein
MVPRYEVNEYGQIYDDRNGDIVLWADVENVIERLEELPDDIQWFEVSGFCIARDIIKKMIYGG